MIRKTITYTNFDGEQRTEEAFFNLSRLDTIKLMAAGGNIQKRVGLIRKLAEETQLNHDDEAQLRALTEMVDLCEDIVRVSYGKKSDDGKRFVKSKELTEEFTSSPAYDELVISLINDNDEFYAFMRGVMPADVAKNMPENMTQEEAQRIINSMENGEMPALTPSKP